MKHFFLSVLTVCTIVTVHAQKFEIGVNAGAAVNYMAAGEADAPLGVVSKGLIHVNAPSVSVKAMRVSKKWKYGLSVDYSSCTYTVTQQPGCILYGIPSGMTLEDFQQLQRKRDAQTYGTHTIS